MERLPAAQPQPFPELRPHDDALYDLIVAGLGPRGAAPLLDVGSGEGTALSALLGGTGLSGVALDRRRPASWHGPAGFARLRGDGARLPFPDRTFPVVLSSESLEWFARPVAALREMARVGRRRLVLAQSDWSSLWFDSGDPETSREFTRLYAGPEAARGASLPPLLHAAGLAPDTHARQTVRGDALEPGTLARQLLHLLRQFLVVQRAVVRARRFDDWQADLAQRAARGAFAFSLVRHVLVAELGAP